MRSLLRTYSRSVASVFLCTAFLWIAVGSVRSDEPKDPTYLCRIDIQLDREKALKAGVATNLIGQSVSAFLKKHDKFSIRDLESLMLPTVDGHVTRLSEVASVDIVLSRKQDDDAK